jgi:hypothetical protein
MKTSSDLAHPLTDLEFVPTAARESRRSPVLGVFQRIAVERLVTPQLGEAAP